MSAGLILLAHGSRDPGWRSPFERLASRRDAAAGSRPAIPDG